VFVSSISATLPNGFSYVPGSTSGFLSSDPAVSGQTLTWSGPFALGAGASVALHFDVALDSALPAHTYTTTASARTDKAYTAAAAVAIRGSRIPLIVVPGIMGSELSCAGVNIWPTVAIDRSGALFDALELAGHGSAESSCPAPMSADAVIRSAYGQDEYGSLLEGLQDAGYEPGTTLFTYPYDWRKSVAASAVGLLEEIDAVRAQTGAERVDVLAHSQGGLVTRVALSLPQSVGTVRRVLTLGTPYYGAAKLLAILLTGSPCVPGNVEFSFLFVHVAYCPLDGDDVRAVVATLPGAYDLLPSAAYLGAVRPPILVDGVGLTPSGYQAYLEALADPTLVDSAFQYHATYDAQRPTDPAVQWLQVLGRGSLSIGDVFLSSDPNLNWATFQYIDGDGTVPAGSAASGGLFPTAHVDGVEHMGLVQDACVQSFAVEYFEADSAPGGDGCVLADSGSGTAVARLAVSSPAGLELAVDGGLTGVVTDDAGRTTAGTTPIPNSDYNTAGSSQSFLFRDPGTYHASFSAGSSGFARIRVRSLSLTGVLGQALFLVPDLPDGARLVFDVGSGPLDAQTIGVDRNGDGSVDEQLAPDAVVASAAGDDVTPPSASGDATLASNGLSRVTLAADDDQGGSGVAHLYYRVGSGDERTYSGPFDVPMLSRVTFRAMDRSGNMSDETGLVADDAPDTMRFAEALTPKAQLDRFVDPSGDDDRFRFDADGVSTYRAQIVGLPADYDLELYDADGRLVAAPHRRGKESEEIRQRLAAGRYYLRVRGYAGAWDATHPYQLKLQTLGGLTPAA
jgi:lecithin:cholesterol acyltransferase